MLPDLFVRYGYAMVFVAAAFEADATLLASTFLAHRGYLDFRLVIVVVVSASVAANQVYFWIARGYGKARIAAMRSHRLYGRAIGWLSRYRVVLALASRFIYGFRIAIPMASGASGMSPVVFTVVERPVIRAVEYLGNDSIRTKKLSKETDLKVGGPVDPYAVEEARRKIIALYQRSGFNDVQVVVVKGDKPTDQFVVFSIHEGPKQKIWKVVFEGNEFASDGQQPLPSLTA